MGTGTGQAAVPFARLGYRVTGLEPGMRLAGVARRRLLPFPDAVVVEGRLEDWEPEPGAYDLVVSGTAWHHPDRTLKYAKAASALTPGGALAVFWNAKGAWEPGLRAQLDRAYARHTPGIAAIYAPRDSGDRLTGPAVEIAESGLFGAPRLGSYPWSRGYGEREYLALLDTYSDHIRLPAAARRALYADIADIIRRRGGAITVPYQSVLFVARRIQ